ncbi:hypothetical protein WH52_00220 [Tenacibaculum holothuriorum]|uniref:Anti-sigma factor n=1 Tax=Tenacibaculum holothuriorum TaxID=1635173 RepID=A0A1Y2PG36_9FLAO|nr:hypothetical protein [Tenacibaculum holothuriorum]OSY89120.1 hypothetical protein WH52_00220 [Tenacibaculum holothuriorum]
MDDKLHQFFSENDFDIHEPHSGHLERFQRKLNTPKKVKTISWKWMSIAASVILLLGFYLGSFQQKSQYDLSDVSPKMAEAQSFFVNTINQELKEIEKYRNIDTESIIENTLDKLEELEEQYNVFIAELNTNDNKISIIQAMIDNYQRRLTLLQDLLFLLKNDNPAKIQTQFDEII